jgi:hypothetical protein
LADATISPRETHSDLVLARSEHSQRGAQQSEQYVDGAQRAIKLKKRFNAQLPAQEDSKHAAVIARLSE